MGCTSSKLDMEQIQTDRKPEELAEVETDQLDVVQVEVGPRIRYVCGVHLTRSGRRVQKRTALSIFQYHLCHLPLVVELGDYLLVKGKYSFIQAPLEPYSCTTCAIGSCHARRERPTAGKFHRRLVARFETGTATRTRA